MVSRVSYETKREKKKKKTRAFRRKKRISKELII